VYIAAANYVTTCTHGHASIYSLSSASLLPHTLFTNTTAHAVHCTLAHGSIWPHTVLIAQCSYHYKAAGVNEHHRYMTCLLGNTWPGLTHERGPILPT
jgi:hypothetical protein